MAKTAETKPKEDKEKTSEVKMAKKGKSDESNQLQFYKSIVDNFSDAICVSDMKLNVIAVNPAIEHLTGYTVDEMVGLSVTNMPIIGKDDLKKIMKEMPRLQKGETIENLELEIIHKSGRKVPSISSSAIIKDDDGKPMGMVVSVRDITDIKELMKKQEEAANFSKSIIDNMSDAVTVSNTKMEIIQTNSAIETMTGYTPDEVLGKKSNELEMIGKKEMAEMMKMMPDLLKGKSVDNIEMEIIKKDGSRMPTLISAAPLKDSDGKMTGMVTTIRDITEIKKLMKEQEEAANFSKSIIDNMSDMVCISDTSLKIIDSNAATEKITGYKVEDVVGKKISDLDMLDKESMATMMKETMPKILKGEAVENQESEIIAKDGRRIPTLTSTGIVRDSDGKMTGMVTTIRDITDIKNLIKEQEDSAAYFSNMINNISDMILTVDPALKIGDMNPAGEAITGYDKEEFLGKPLTSLPMFDKEALSIVMKVIPEIQKKGSVTDIEIGLTDKNKKKIPVLCSVTMMKDTDGKSAGMVVVGKDVTDIKNMMQEQEEAAAYLNKNVKKMLEVTKAAASGDLSKKVKKERDDEVGALADGLNSMIENIDKMMKEQEEAAKYLEKNVKKMLEVTTAAAAGDLSKNVVKERDDEVGELADGINYMIQNINKVMNQQEEAAKYLETNVKHMLEVTTAAAAGDLSKKVKKERDDEVGALADGLNGMIANIDRMMKEQEEQRIYLEENTARLSVALQAAAGGDLTVRLKKEREDDIGNLIDAYNETVERLTGILTSNLEVSKKVLDSSNNLAGTSEEMNAGMEQLASGASQVAEASQKLADIVQETAKDIDAASSILIDTDKSLTKSSDEGISAIKVSKEVQAAAKDAGVSFDKIQGSITETSQSVGKMSNSIDKVSEMGNVITDVASQTNMLALNAAIEAARAGEAGKGFAVVADAVKDLAEQVKNAARESISAVEEIKASGTHAISVSTEADNEAG
ncbi:MAG: PAS domain S-box protein, partial [Halobacteriota archaeon]|nr:PAS domain S-box protein [Halobacteriota archaeon]